MINEDLTMKALTNTIDIIKKNEGSSELVVTAILILSIYVKELNRLLEEEKEND